MSLETLPKELQCSIIRLLDPIGLISISQTSTYFRQLVNPKKKHFVERLLALESLVDYGGPSLIFRSRDNKLNLPWSNPEWEKIRWACADCLRLLSHTHFNNHSILRLRYRKPIPDSSASHLVSSWEPVDYMSPSERRQQKRNAHATAQNEKMLRQRYFFCVAADLLTSDPGDFQKSGVGSFQNMSRAEIIRMDSSLKSQAVDEDARAIELEHCGKRRQFRRCNECRYLRGEMRSSTRPMGTQNFPVMPSRQYLFVTGLDRWFPGFTAYLERKRPTFDGSVPLDSVKCFDSLWSNFWAMYMVRCPGCACWKELRDFRLGGIHHRWTPSLNAQWQSGTWDEKQMTDELLSESRCNSCFERANGRQELVAVLQGWILRLIDVQLLLLSWRLLGGFKTLTLMWLKSLPDKYRLEIKHMARHTPCMSKDDDYRLNYTDVAMLKLRQNEWLGMWKQLRESHELHPSLKNMDGWCDYWTKTFETWEFLWRWWMWCKVEVNEDPDILADWAFETGSAAITSFSGTVDW